MEKSMCYSSKIVSEKNKEAYISVNIINMENNTRKEASIPTPNFLSRLNLDHVIVVKQLGC